MSKTDTLRFSKKKNRHITCNCVLLYSLTKIQTNIGDKIPQYFR